MSREHENEDKLAQAICELVCAINTLTETAKQQFATKSDLEAATNKIIGTIIKAINPERVLTQEDIAAFHKIIDLSGALESKAHKLI